MSFDIKYSDSRLVIFLKWFNFTTINLSVLPDVNHTPADRVAAKVEPQKQQQSPDTEEDDEDESDAFEDVLGENCSLTKCFGAHWPILYFLYFLQQFSKLLAGSGVSEGEKF